MVQYGRWSNQRPRVVAATGAHFALVAQGIEHRFPKAGVAGSIPAGGISLGSKHEKVRVFRSRQTSPALRDSW